MNVQSQYPTMTGCSARGSGGCRCTPKSRSSDTDKRNNPETEPNFPRSEYSYKSTSPYDDWSVLDEEDQNTLTALRNKACNFIMAEPEEVSAQTSPQDYSYDTEPRYVYPSLVRKANDMIDYVPQSEFLKKMKQQCQFLESYRPNIFSAVAEGIITESFDIEKFVEETTQRAREAPYPTRQCKTAPDGTARQRYDLPVSNELLDQSCSIDRNNLTYLVEGIEPSDQNLTQPKSGKKKKSEHISRSKTPHKGRGRRKRKSGSGEAGEIEDEGGFEPTLKRPHENSCERCWRYASPSRSPVNKPDQKYDPNFRRGHSCYDFERGDADVYDRHISPCKNLQPLTSREKISSPTLASSFIQKTPPSNFIQNTPPPTFPQKTQPLGFPQKTPHPGYPQKTPPVLPQKTPLPGFPPYTPPSSLPQDSTSSSFMQRTPSARPKECVSLWQKPAAVHTASEPVYQRLSEMHPSPQPAFQSRISEMHPSPHPSFQHRVTEVHPSPQPGYQSRISEIHPSPQPACQNRISEMRPSPQPAFQSRFSEMHPSPHPSFQHKVTEVPPSPQPAFQSRISEMHPSPHPGFQHKVTEVHSSPRPAFQQECLATSHPVVQQKAVPVSPVRQQKPQVQFRSGGHSPTRISFYDNYPDGPPERTVPLSPVLDCSVDPNRPTIYSEQAWTRPKSVQIMPEKLPDIPPVEMQQFSDNFNDLNATKYKTISCIPRDQTAETSYSRSSPTAESTFDESYHSPRQSSPRPCSTGLGTIIEAADSDSSKTQTLKEEEKTPKCKKVKSPKNSSKQSLGSPRRSSGSNRVTSPSKVHTPNKSGSPKKGKPKSPSPKPSPNKSQSGSGKSPEKSQSGGERSPEKSQSGGGKSPNKSQNESRKCQKISPQKQKSPESSKRTRSSIEVKNAHPPTPEQRPRTSDPRVKDRSPAKSPVKEPVKAPAENYARPDHLFTRCPCQPSLSISNDADYEPGHLVCCHCNWQERLRKQANQHKTSRDQNEPQAEGSRRVSPEKLLEQNPKGYDSVAYRCPYLSKTGGQGSANSPEAFGEAEIRLMRDQRKELSYEDLSPIPCSPRQYFVFYMTKSKENKADDDVEVLVEELTQSCPKKTDSRTKDITERMKKIMECPSDSMALRFQKGVFEPCKVPQSSRILYF